MTIRLCHRSLLARGRFAHCRARPVRRCDDRVRRRKAKPPRQRTAWPKRPPPTPPRLSPCAREFLRLFFGPPCGDAFCATAGTILSFSPPPKETPDDGSTDGTGTFVWPR